MTEAARNGDKTAQHILIGLAKHRNQDDVAIAWYKVAADQGQAWAMSDLGEECARRGDFAQASKWHRQALSVDPAMTSSAVALADMIFDARIPGTAADAAALLEHAAALGHRTAARRFGELTLAGTIVAQDVDAGLRWLARAARAGDATAAGALAVAYRDGQYGPADVTRAAEWSLLHERLNAGGTLHPIAVPPPTDAPPPLPVDASDALREMWERIGRGSLLAMTQLGEAYAQGTDVPVDHAKAAYWYTKAASGGGSLGHYALGAMILNGHRQGSKAEAAALIEWAAYGVVPEAEAAYGLLVMTGRGVPKDEPEGAYWVRRSALHGCAWGKYLYAKALIAGRGTPQDEAAGRALLIDAARAGYGQPQ